MTERSSILLGLAIVAGVVGCSSSDGGAQPAPLDPTFTNVTQQAVNTKKCSGAACHTTDFGGFSVVGAKSDLYAALVNQAASGPKCGPGPDGGASPYIRVVPGKPDESLLYLKVNHTPPCGDSMPSIGEPLTSAEITLVHDWIAAGAKND